MTEENTDSSGVGRREFLGAAGAAGIGSLAGCTDDDAPDVAEVVPTETGEQGNGPDDTEEYRSGVSVWEGSFDELVQAEVDLINTAFRFWLGEWREELEGFERSEEHEYLDDFGPVTEWEPTNNMDIDEAVNKLDLDRSPQLPRQIRELYDPDFDETTFKHGGVGMEVGEEIDELAQDDDWYRVELPELEVWLGREERLYMKEDPDFWAQATLTYSQPLISSLVSGSGSRLTWFDDIRGVSDEDNDAFNAVGETFSVSGNKVLGKYADGLSGLDEGHLPDEVSLPSVGSEEHEERVDKFESMKYEWFVERDEKALQAFWEYTDENSSEIREQMDRHPMIPSDYYFEFDGEDLYFLNHPDGRGGLRIPLELENGP